MPQNSYKTQSEKYEFISGQHGGYYRHDFIDHAYLYNLYFPPEAVFTKLKDQIHDLVLNYPMAQDALAGLVSKIIDQPAARIVVGNGAAELIKIVSGHISGKLIVPVPSFNEYANAAPPGQVVEPALRFRRLGDVVVGAVLRQALGLEHLGHRGRQGRLAVVNVADRPNVNVRFCSLKYFLRHSSCSCWLVIRKVSEALFLLFHIPRRFNQHTSQQKPLNHRYVKGC